MEDNKRFKLIEVSLLWDGGVNAKKLQDYFDISRTTAQRHIDDYKSAFPQNIARYDNKEKIHVPSHHFDPRVTSGSLSEYLSFFGTGEEAIVSDVDNSNLHIELLPAPIRNIEPKLIRSVIKACKQKLRVDIGYFSVSSGVTEGRIISPHSIVFDGVRWHTRAWCERSLAYRDFVLSRFHDEPVIEDSTAIYTKAQDEDWNNVVDLIIEPDPRLSDIQRYAIELDYRMVNGRLVIPCRAALIKYVIQKLRLDSYNQNPEGQQIIVEANCWNDLEPYRLKS